MSNPRYPEEFKIQAVNQVTEKYASGQVIYPTPQRQDMVCT